MHRCCVSCQPRMSPLQSQSGLRRIVVDRIAWHPLLAQTNVVGVIHTVAVPWCSLRRGWYLKAREGRALSTGATCGAVRVPLCTERVAGSSPGACKSHAPTQLPYRSPRVAISFPVTANA